MGEFLSVPHSNSTVKMDHYEKIRFLGKGGFGVATLYKDLRDQRECVIKVVDLKQITSAEREIARKEVEVLRSVKHPNIVHYHDSFYDGSMLCIVMENCEGGDLQGKIRSQKQPFLELQIWTWFVEICHALKYLHCKKIIHRDLKPPNIFLTRDNSIRLGDFGLASVLAYTAVYLKTSAGTVAFFAPEMARGQDYNHKVDIWALGVTLYNLITLKLPFAGDNFAAVLNGILNESHGPVVGYSRDLCSLVDKLLQKEPKVRPSITELLELPEVKKRASPLQRLQNVYRFQINDQGQLCDADGNRYQFDLYQSKLDNGLRFDGIANALEEYLYDQMEALGLKRLPVPVQAQLRPDYDNLATFIFVTENWDTCEKLIIFIHGSGKVKAGQWTQKLMIKNSMDEGTQLPYIRKALTCGYGVMVLNTNDNNPSEGCQSPVKHGLYVWENYIQNTEATRIAVKAHSAGGSITQAVMAKFSDDFKRRVYANAFTGVGGNNYSTAVLGYAKKVTRNWVTSKAPLGTPVQVHGCDVDCVSAGTNVHEETPYKSYHQVFDFIEKRFQDTSPGNL